MKIFLASNPVLTLMVFTSFILAGCTPNATEPAPTTAIPTASQMPTIPAEPTPAPTAEATETAVPFSDLTLKAGDLYFSLDGTSSYLLSRNLTGKTRTDYDTLLEWAHQGSTGLIRIHLTHGWWGDPWIQKDWTVNEKWAQDWDGFLDRAQADGIAVILVFGVWADWNDGTPDWGSPLWQYNPLNKNNGGPLNRPQELFQADSVAQNAWLKWVKTLVERWQRRENIAAWEIFSEINIASGAPGHADPQGGLDEATGLDFTNKTVAVIRDADPRRRPITLSLAGVYAETDLWAEYYNLEALDFIEIHPYSDTLDRELIQETRSKLARYQKPVMIGESGLWSMTHNPHAATGIAHAVWAGLVSGAMNGRALWDNDGYAIYSIDDPAEAMQFLQAYTAIEKPVADFINGVDFTGYRPLESTSSMGAWGAAVGNEHSAIAWFRDATSEPPDWKLQPVVSNQTVTITIPGDMSRWTVDFYDTKTATTAFRSITVTRTGQSITFSLPDFQDDIAIKITAAP